MIERPRKEGQKKDSELPTDRWPGMGEWSVETPPVVQVETRVLSRSGGENEGTRRGLGRSEKSPEIGSQDRQKMHSSGFIRT